MNRLLVLCVAALASGCVNPYAQFYRGMPDARTMPGYEAPSGPLQIYTTNDFARDRLALMAKGYAPVGESSFNANAARVSDSELRSQAEKIGASAVLISSKYTGTVSGAIPLTVPDNTTSYSTGTATAYGSVGMVNAYGQSTTTTYGTRTMMMPYTVTRADFGVLYFAKQKMRLGVYLAPLDDATRQRRQSNAGAIIQVVVEGSPAYLADVLPGDLLLAIGSDPMESVDGLGSLLNKYQGQTVALTLERSGKQIEKQVTIRGYDPVTTAAKQ